MIETRIGSGGGPSTALASATAESKRLRAPPGAKRESAYSAQSAPFAGTPPIHVVKTRPDAAYRLRKIAPVHCQYAGRPAESTCASNRVKWETVYVAIPARVAPAYTSTQRAGGGD